jgi:hypothetical protein
MLPTTVEGFFLFCSLVFLVIAFLGYLGIKMGIIDFSAAEHNSLFLLSFLMMFSLYLLVSINLYKSGHSIPLQNLAGFLFILGTIGFTIAVFLLSDVTMYGISIPIYNRIDMTFLLEEGSPIEIEHYYFRPGNFFSQRATHGMSPFYETFQEKGDGAFPAEIEVANESGGNITCDLWIDKVFVRSKTGYLGVTCPYLPPQQT